MENLSNNLRMRNLSYSFRGDVRRTKGSSWNTPSYPPPNFSAINSPLGDFSAPSWTSRDVSSDTAINRPLPSKNMTIYDGLRTSGRSSLSKATAFSKLPFTDYCARWKDLSPEKSSNRFEQGKQDPHNVLSMREWKKSENKISLSDITAGSPIEASWTCEKCSQTFFERVNFRIFGRGPDTTACPSCIQKESIVHTHPLIAAEYTGICYDALDKHYFLNARQLTAGDAIKGQWKCRFCGYKWISAVSSRALKTEISISRRMTCPSCAIINGTRARTERIPLENFARLGPHTSDAGQSQPGSMSSSHGMSHAHSLLHAFPLLYKELNMKRHRKWRLSQLKSISVYSHEKLHWICRKCNREYQASPYERVFGSQKNTMNDMKDIHTSCPLPECCPKCLWIDRQTAVLLAEELEDLSQLTDASVDNILKIKVDKKSRRLPTEVNSSCHRHDVGIRMMDNHLIN